MIQLIQSSILLNKSPSTMSERSEKDNGTQEKYIKIEGNYIPLKFRRREDHNNINGFNSTYFIATTTFKGKTFQAKHMKKDDAEYIIAMKIRKFLEDEKNTVIEFIDSLQKHENLKNYYLNNLSSNLERSNNIYRRFLFYIIIIPILYISIDFSESTSVNFIGIEFNKTLIVSIFPVIYSYITLRTMMYSLHIENLEQLITSFFENSIGEGNQKYIKYLYNLELVSKLIRKDNNLENGKYLISNIMSTLFLLLFSIPIFFQIYLIFNLAIAEMDHIILYYCSLTISIMMSLRIIILIWHIPTNTVIN